LKWAVASTGEQAASAINQVIGSAYASNTALKKSYTPSQNLT
jgi:hypothetical protein